EQRAFGGDDRLALFGVEVFQIVGVGIEGTGLARGGALGNCQFRRACVFLRKRNLHLRFAAMAFFWKGRLLVWKLVELQRGRSAFRNRFVSVRPGLTAGGFVVRERDVVCGITGIVHSAL